jgi:hypothetical protein
MDSDNKMCLVSIKASTQETITKRGQRGQRVGVPATRSRLTAYSMLVALIWLRKL